MYLQALYCHTCSSIESILATIVLSHMLQLHAVSIESFVYLCILGQVDISLTLAVTALVLRTVLHVISTAKHGLEKYAFHRMFCLLFHHTIIIARGVGWWHGLISINRLPLFLLCHRLLCETQTLLHWTSLMSTLKNVQTLQD